MATQEAQTLTASPPPKKRRWLRRILWLLGSLLMLPVVILLLFLVLWQIGPSRALVRSVGLSVASGFLHGKLELDSLGGTLLTGLEVNGVRWYSRQGKLIAGLKRLDVRYDLMKFVTQGELVVTSLTLEKPEGYLFVQKDGQINLLAHLNLGPPSQTPPPKVDLSCHPQTFGKSAGFRLSVQKIAIRDVRFSWGEGEKALRVEGLNLSTDFKMIGSTLLAHLSDLHLDLFNPDVKVRKISLRFKMETICDPRTKTQITQLHAKQLDLDFGQRSALHLDATIKDLSTLDMEVKSRKFFVATDDIKRVVPVYPVKPDIRADLFTAHGPLSDLKANLKLRLGQTSLGLDARAGILNQSYDVKLQLSKANLAEILGNSGLESLLFLELTAKGKGFSDKTKGKVHLKVQPSSFQQFKIEEVSVLVDAADGAFTIPALRVRTPYLNIPKGEAYVKLDGGIVRADIDGRIANLSALGKVVKQKLAGSVSFNLKAKGNKFLPQATITLNGRSIRHPAASVETIRLRAALLDLQPITAEIKELSVQGVQAGGQTVYRADIGLQYKMGQGKQGPAHLVRLDKLQFDIGTGLFRLQPKNKKTRTQISFQDDLATLKNFRLQNDRSSARQRLRRQLAILRRHLLRAPKKAVTTRSFATYQSELKRRAEQSDLPRPCRALYKQQYLASRAPTHPTRRSASPSKQRSSRSKQRSSRSKQRSARSKQRSAKTTAAAKVYTIASCHSILERAEQRVEHATQACTTQNPESIAIQDARFHIKGAGQTLGLAIRDLAVGCVTGVLGIMPDTPLRGYLDVALDVAGDFRKPRLENLSVRLKDGRFDKFRDLTLALNAYYNPKRSPKNLRIPRDVFHLDLNAGYKELNLLRRTDANTPQKTERKLIALRAHLPIRAALQGMPRQPIQFERKLREPILFLSIPNISLGWLARVLNQGDFARGQQPGTLQIGGTVDAEIKLLGPLSVPTLDLRFALEKGRYEQLNDIDLKLNVHFHDGELRLPKGENRLYIQKKPIFALGGMLPLHLRLSPSTRPQKRKAAAPSLYWLDDTPLDFFFKIYGQQVQTWRDFLPADLRDAISGLLHADILLAGKPTAPSFRFDVRFEEGSFCPLVSQNVQLSAKERRALLKNAQAEETKRIAALRKKGKSEAPQTITLDEMPFTRSVSAFRCSQKVRSLVSKQPKSTSLRVKGIHYHLGLRYLPPGQSHEISPLCPKESGCFSFFSKLHLAQHKAAKATTYFELPEKTNWLAMTLRVDPKTLQPSVRIFDHVSLDLQMPGLPLRDLYRFVRIPALLQLKPGSRFVFSFREQGKLSQPRLALSARLQDVGYEMGRDVDDKPLYLDGVQAHVDLSLQPGQTKALVKTHVFNKPLLTNATRYDLDVAIDLDQLNQMLPGNPPPKSPAKQSMVRVEAGRFFSNRLTFHNFRLENFAQLGGIYTKLAGMLTGAVLLEGDPACPEWKTIEQAQGSVPPKESHIELRNGIIGDRGSPKAQSKEFVAALKAREAFEAIARRWRVATSQENELSSKISQIQKKPNLTDEDKAKLRSLLAQRQDFRRRTFYPITGRYNRARQALLAFSRNSKKALRFSHFYIGFFSTTNDEQTQKDGRTRILLKMVQDGSWKIEGKKRIMRGFDILDGEILAALPLALAAISNPQERQRRCPAFKQGKADERLYVKLGVIGERMKLDFIEAFAPGIELQGEPKLVINLSGTLQSPEIKSGQVGVEISKLTYPAFGVEIGEQKNPQNRFAKPMRSQFVIQLKPKQYQVLCRLYGKTGTPFQIDGWIAHKNFVPTDMSLKIFSKEFKPMDTLRYRTTLQTNISIQEALNAPKIRGSITIPEFLFTLPESSRSPQTYIEDEDIYVLGEPRKKRRSRDPFEEKPPASGITQKMLLDLRIIIPRNFFVRNRDLSIEAKTEDFRPLGVNLQRGRLRLTGGLQIQRGELAFYGKKFLVESGSAVAFTGQSFGMDELGYIDPKLNVIAVYIVKVQSGTSLAKQGYKRVKVLLKALGSAQNPIIEFEVIDADTETKISMDRINVLSLILTGTTTEDLSRGQQDNITKQAVGMVGSAVASELKNALSGVVKMDVLNIETGANVSDLKVEAGWYLTPDLYLEVAVKPAPLEEESYLDMRLDYAINRNLSLELRSGLVKRNDALWFRGSGHFFVKGKFLCLWPFCPEEKKRPTPPLKRKTPPPKR